MSGQVPPPRRRITLLRAVSAALAALTLLALLPLLYTPFRPEVRVGVPLQAATPSVWLGTDEIGRDLLTRLLTGLSLAWLPSLAVVAVSALVGALLGTIAGMAPGWFGRLVHVPINLFRALPAPVMAMAIVAVFGPGLWRLLAGLALFGWPWYARMVRAEIIAAHATSYGQIARLSAPGRLFYFLPAVLPRLTVAAAVDVGNTVLLLAVLSFLGLSDPPPSAELGAMTHAGLGYALDYPRMALLPAVLVFGAALTAHLSAAVFRRRLVRT